MNRRMTSNASLTTAAFTLLLLLLFCPTHANARQWATASNSSDIKNTNAGSVGVGTTDPSLGGAVAARVSVIQSDGNTGLAVGNASGVPRFALNGNSAGSWTMYDYGTGAWSAGITQKGGRVGIGTTSPANALHVSSSTGAQALRVSGFGGAFMNFQDTTAAPDQRLYQWRSEGGLFRMALLNDAENAFARENILVANSSGNIGIGTGAPLQRLQIGGSAASGTNSPDAISLGATYSLTARANPKLRLFDDNSQGNVYGLGVSPSQLDLIVPAGSRYVWSVGGAEKMRLDEAGNITVAGNITAKYQDVAEWVPSSQKLEAGTVVVLDSSKTNHVLASTKSYDTGVAGVVSESPGIILGEGGADKLKVATTGRVKVRVDATRAPIKVGDLLVTSDVEGVAMKSVEVDLGGVKLHRPGTIIGKALEPLASGAGEILVLLSLQ